jgi:hypothetical protein
MRAKVGLGMFVVFCGSGALDDEEYSRAICDLTGFHHILQLRISALRDNALDCHFNLVPFDRGERLGHAETILGLRKRCELNTACISLFGKF